MPHSYLFADVCFTLPSWDSRPLLVLNWFLITVYLPCNNSKIKSIMVHINGCKWHRSFTLLCFRSAGPLSVVREFTWADVPCVKLIKFTLTSTIVITVKISQPFLWTGFCCLCKWMYVAKIFKIITDVCIVNIFRYTEFFYV